MDLPTRLRAAIDALAASRAQADLVAAGEMLSRRYRSETRDGRLHLEDGTGALAYVAARMPATFAAVADSMTRIAERRPDFRPESLIDVGAGPGTALWAAAEYFPLREARLIEASAPIRAIGARLAEGAFGFEPAYVPADATSADLGRMRADLVTLCYVLDELDPAAVGPLVDRLFAATRDVLLIVEPGTPAGWRRILFVRDRLLAAGAHLLAPCPHEASCPVAAPDWCHFARRLPRSRLHRVIKGGEAPFEDEKFAYVAVSREAVPGPAPARILAHPRSASGRIALKLCQPDGRLGERLVTRREGEAYRCARRAGWGDAI